MRRRYTSSAAERNAVVPVAFERGVECVDLLEAAFDLKTKV